MSTIPTAYYSVEHSTSDGVFTCVDYTTTLAGAIASRAELLAARPHSVVVIREYDAYGKLIPGRPVHDLGVYGRFQRV